MDLRLIFYLFIIIIFFTVSYTSYHGWTGMGTATGASVLPPLYRGSAGYDQCLYGTLPRKSVHEKIFCQGNHDTVKPLP